MFEGSPIPVGLCTVTVAVVSGISGNAPAVIVADPSAPGVIATCTLVALAANVTVDGTVAMFVSLELRLMVTPEAGAGEERVSVTF